MPLFYVRIEDVDGIDISKDKGQYLNPDSIMFSIEVGNEKYTRNLDDKSVKVFRLTDENENQVTKLWVGYRRHQEKMHETGIERYYPYGAVVNIKVDVANRHIESTTAGYAFQIESEVKHIEAVSNSPAMSDRAYSADSNFTDGEEIQVMDNTNPLYGAKIIYEYGDFDEDEDKPTFGPTNEIPDLEESVEGVVAVGVLMNLQPPDLFDPPVKIFFPDPESTDVSDLSIYYFNGKNWALACDAAGNVQPGGEGWMVPGSRVNHNETDPPTIEIQVYHFSGGQPGGSDIPLVDSIGGEGCFIATAAFGSIFERHVRILRQFRDVYLLPTKAGQAFVKAYYKYSPSVAEFIADHDTLRTMVRWSLLPVVGLSWMALQIGVAPTLLLLMAGLFMVFVVMGRRFTRVLAD